ncbi:hypothetical protein [Roseateles amylovorans]|uniref:Uncharacterized protein n=1 Tax=Roseateles amylovorans TaxID=2978473 RepID=A0ABY6B672_9BURK|nr:hypothetical protein [Roseateles amylovorans]UXH79053.1 hypothetical protein N4261_03705 [Roseateles amylovorans]
MSLRYRFIDFASITDDSELLRAIAPPASEMQAFALIGLPLQPFKHVAQHLRKIGAQALLVQESVRDPDFLAEHEAFYSKQHRVISRLCVRLHAFAAPAPAPVTDEAQAARSVLDFLDTLPEPDRQYLGFVTIRPLRHAPIGASILLPSLEADVTCYEHFPVHIAGRDFQVCGTPYLQQDNAVGACAQASIWIALRTQMKRVGNTAYNPADLTRAATRYMAIDRVFPGRQGLVIEQMLEAIRSSGHDPLTLTCEPALPTMIPSAAGVIEQAMPYLESGLPVIATLVPPGGGHAVVCIGRQLAAQPVSSTVRIVTPLGIAYRVASDWVEALIIHNDNTGPYMRLSSGDPKATAYCLEQTKNLIVPLPEAVHMTAKEAEQAALKALAFTCVLLSQYDTTKQMRLMPEGKVVLRTRLVKRHAFRRWALADDELDPALKDWYRTIEMPRLVWLVELHDLELFDPRNPNTCSRIGEFVLDASADTLHGDVTLAARVSCRVLPSYSVPHGLLVLDYGSEVVTLASGAPGKSLSIPWE